jgi:hypothetical protein
MGVTYLPGAPQLGQSGNDPQGLVQLAMAVKSFKMQEAQQKRQQAQEKAQLLMSNPSLLVMTDPKDVEKALKEGYGLTFNEKTPSDPAKATQVPTDQGGAGGGGTAPANVDPNKLAQLGASTGKTGQGAGGGGSPSTGAQPGLTSPGVVEHLTSQANQVQMDKLGKLAPLYLGAVDAMTMEHMRAQTVTEIEGLRQRAVKGDFQALGRLMTLSGKQISDADMRGMIASSNMDPKVVQQALDFALGNETDGEKAKRFDSTLKTLMGNQEFMGRLVNPGDATAYARSVVYSGQIPEGIQMKPHSIQELTQEAGYEKQLTDEGLDLSFAHTIARMRTDGINYTMGLPPGFHSITERKVGAQEGQAEAAKTAANADMLKAQNEARKIAGELHFKLSDQLNERLRTMVEAAKAKHPFPKDVEEGLINELATQTGLMPERVTKWYQYVTGGHEYSYTPVPDTDLAVKAAGARSKEKPKAGKKSDTSIGSYLDILNRALGMTADVTTGKPKGADRTGPQ